MKLMLFFEETSLQINPKTDDQNYAQANINLDLLFLNVDTDVPINKEKAINKGYEKAKLYI